jgi:cytochrome c553
MAHKDINEDWGIPVGISIAAGVLLYVGMSVAEYRGQPTGNKCIGACYEAVLERRAIALAAKQEQERLILAGVIEAPVVVEDPTPPMWAGCTGCHGQQGEGMGMFPKIAGQTKEYITGALYDYKGRKQRGKQSMIMWSQASLLEDRDIETLGKFISEL